MTLDLFLGLILAIVLLAYFLGTLIHPDRF